MSAPTTNASVTTAPTGTGTTITPTLPTHAVGDVIEIFVVNSGVTAWSAPAGWTTKQQQASSGNASTGVIGTLLYRRVLSGDSLPLASPVCNLGATVTRSAVALTKRGADLEGVHTLQEWLAFGSTAGTANPVRPPTVVTRSPENLVHIYYGSRSATIAPEQTNYTQVQQVINSGIIVNNVSERTIADQNTSLANQDASPTSGARWIAMISCTPSPDYPYYRSGSQAFNAAGLNATPALPTGTTASDNRGNKDLIIATVECAGSPTIAPNTPADWTALPDWSNTTSGGGTTVRKYATLYDGSLDRQFNRSTSGEIFVYFSVYHNAHQTIPTGLSAVQQNASSTTSTFPALARTGTKATVQATCVADATPTFTAPTGWTERNDSQGVTCADQSFNATGSTASASFTLSTASPTLCGLMEVFSVASSINLILTPANSALAVTGFVPKLITTITTGSTSLSLITFAPALIRRTVVTPGTGTLALSTFNPAIRLAVVPALATLTLSTTVPLIAKGVVPLVANLILSTFVPQVTVTDHITVTPDSTALTLTGFAPAALNSTPGYRTSTANASTFVTVNPSLAFNIGELQAGDLLVVYAFVSGNTNNTPTCSDDAGGTYDLIDVASVVIDSVDYRLSVFVRTALITETNTGSFTIIVNTGSNTSRVIHAHVIQGMSRTGAGAIRSKGLQSDQPAGTAAPALNQSALSGNITIVALGSADTSTTEPSGWTERQDNSTTAPTIALATATRDGGFTGTTITFGAAQDTAFASHALELDTSSVGVTVTPANASLTLTSFASVLRLSATPASANLMLTMFAVQLRQAVTPPTQPLTLATFAPSVTIQVTVPSASLSLTTFAPIVDVSADVLVTPAAAGLTLTSFAAQLREVITPASRSLALATFAPKLVQVITPTNATLSLTSFAPTARTNTILTPASTALTITTTAPQLHEVVTPSAATLSLTTFTPTVEIDVTVTPTTALLVLSTFASVLREQMTPAAATLTVTAFAPTVEVSADITVTPPAASLTLTRFAPALHERLAPTTASLSLVTFAPTITVSADKVVQPANTSLTLQSFAPQLQLVVTPVSAVLVLSASAPSLQLMVQPVSVPLVLSTFAPTVDISGDITVTPAQTSLTLTAFAPVVTTGGVVTTITPAPAILTLTSYAPWLFLGLVPARRTYVVNSGKYEVEISAGEYEFVDNYEDDEVLV